MKKIIDVLIIALLVISCNKDDEFKSIVIDIKGMTCEIGCAKLIQSKMYKMAGVSYAEINFEAKKGTITYNSNKININDIVQKIEGIAGGGLYFVSKTSEIPIIHNESN